jgi:hyperosmotically inducible periplasmic protein
MRKVRIVQRLVLSVALGVALAGGCAKPNNAARSAAADDAVLTTRVKTVFINDPSIGGERIDVDTVKGVVTLAGRVQSRAQEAKAIELARAIKGVTDVKSNLQIEP